MAADYPDWLDPRPALARAAGATTADIEQALAAATPDERHLAVLLSTAASRQLEALAQRAQALTRRHFGRTVQLYAPLYLSSHCSGGCLYCGFAADRKTPRHKLSAPQVAAEIRALRDMGLDDILLLTGERTREADLPYLRDGVAAAAEHMHQVGVETFPMTAAEYTVLAAAGCTGVTLYQETYDVEQYRRLHRWGPKRDYDARLAAPTAALDGGLRVVGLGALLGLSDPRADMVSLFRHARQLQKTHWRAGLSLSFPRVRPQAGGYQPRFPVEQRFLAQIIFAFRICLPDVPLVLSTREAPAFRDGMAGVGISRMSVASRTTVGGYSRNVGYSEGQFQVSDNRDVPAFTAMLRGKGLEPVFKNWEAVYR